ncbi:hydrogenase small subunit [Desulfobaculum bizertense]|uniref:cytochrome-c3 hydrogenase n=1 Tax=Desulfobaculum bizertense DSM 18034 TaxID=1121442 RepID=A0A1T4W151_9BACT|nr:hydrogenase small subunit [Desulfobaculum bizertense]UIJ38936.1 hydrogenase small subunit [Desulfobaculum bizertense]SKA70963.1 [NiFe] hydrogenase small subunit [Desulfobaculum bizertense DSM 18034]
MKFSIGSGKHDVMAALKEKGISRRDFMKFCAAVSAAMAADATFTPTKVAEALTAKERPTVVWLHFAECTGCSESVLRSTEPDIATVIFDVLSLDYHETLMQCAGEAIEEVLHKTVKEKEGQFVLVLEGAVPTKDGGIYGKVGGKTMLSILEDVYPKAKATICIGSCSAYGGVQKAAPNPTGAKGCSEALGGAPMINVPGCPPNPMSFIGTVVYYLTKGMPELDEYGRPTLFYGETVHENCPRLKYFEEGLFAPSFDSEEAKKGYCLYELGCKGPDTYNNCPKVLFNQVSFPIQAGHPCIGCSEPDFWDEMSPFYEEG